MKKVSHTLDEMEPRDSSISFLARWHCVDVPQQEEPDRRVLLVSFGLVVVIDPSSVAVSSISCILEDGGHKP